MSFIYNKKCARSIPLLRWFGLVWVDRVAVGWVKSALFESLSGSQLYLQIVVTRGQCTLTVCLVASCCTITPCQPANDLVFTLALH